jgi:two-component system, NtrC family, sensor histidine kinase PilS
LGHARLPPDRVCARGLRERADHPLPLSVRFLDDHLRQVLVNLLDNALRYASVQPCAMRVRLDADDATVVLRVWSDGVPIDASVQQHLFEPFFSSESRSSGLGLYICRTLCERHGAAIAYRRCAWEDPDLDAHPTDQESIAVEGNEFYVVMARADSVAA